jgi:hypothetical protein
MVSSTSTSDDKNSLTITGETMKRLFATTFILFALLVTSQAQALTWSWSFDDVAGTFTTNSIGMTPYENGIYTLTDISVDVVGDSGLPIGSVSDGTWIEDIAPSTFMWTDGVASDFEQGIFPSWAFCTPPGCGIEPYYDFFFDDDGADAFFTESGGNFMKVAGGPLSITPAPVPVPAAAWLFMSGLLGLVWKSRKARQSVA